MEGAMDSNDDVDSVMVSPMLSEAIVNAQREAEAEAALIENSMEEPEPELPEVPQLLQLPHSDLVQKSNEFQEKGQQLDILLLKAQSYSHFLQDSLSKTQIIPTEEPDEVQSSSSKKRKSLSSAAKPSPAKRSPGKIQEAGGSPGDKPASEADSATFLQPRTLTGGTLLPYQVEGLQWLLKLYENGLSGILADEMGLGKTIQVIAFLAYLRQMNVQGPFLIAGPLATIPNWINEFKKWLPSCPVVMYHGSIAERQAIRRSSMRKDKQRTSEFPVVVTSFEICMIDKKYLEHYHWQYIILDEGHRIKNRNCRLVRELKSIPSVSRLLLTGTPIQNTLEELWNLLNFCSPSIFDDLRVFQSWFGFRNIGKETQVDDIISEEQRERVVSKLHGILRPFLLRRMKRDVLLTIPPKQEIVVYCGMSRMQQEYYTHVQAGTIRDALVSLKIEKAHEISQINTLMNLRKVCNHPFLFGEPKDDSGEYFGMADPRHLIIASGKFKLLARMLPMLKQNGHKVLIFSQMTELLDILEDFIIYFGYQYCRLDGMTKVEDRQSGIDRFNRDSEVFVYLLSTRAGGLGINLATADTCIIFDSDWNPHQDSQAQDRCHRIGQHRPVVVYRLLTAGSVEIEMMEKQISKKKLERLAIQGGGFNSAMDGSKGSGKSTLTLAKLRKLLEDDVKNLSRMAQHGSSMTASDNKLATAGATASPDRILSPAKSKLRGRSVKSHLEHVLDIDGQHVDEICDVELRLIMDRSKLFPGFQDNVGSYDVQESTSACLVPAEGRMYDVVAMAEQRGDLLQGVR